jgi:bacteriocin-like protein
LKKAKEAKSAAELAKMAHEQGIMLSDSDAERYYAQFHQEEKELSNDELNNVSGGSFASAEDLAKQYVEVSPDDVCGQFQLAYEQRFQGVTKDKNCAYCHFSTNGRGVRRYFCVH